MRNILSIDGGGVRTYIPLRILNEIEKRTNHSITELFDYMTGVSASSLIINLLLLKDTHGKPQYNTSQILEIFTKECYNIFYYTYLGRCKTVWGLFGPKYCNTSFQEVLNKYFGDKKLGDLIKPSCILSYDLISSKSYYFNSLENPNLKISDCILASTAAPTYFYPYTFPLNERDTNEYLFIDGGVVTNNPAEICFLKAIEYYSSNNLNVGNNPNFLTLSLGTGYSISSKNLNNSYFGLFSWSYNILDTLFSANSNSQSSELSILNKIMMKENNKNKFYRVDVPLKDFIYLDDIYCFDRMKILMDDWITKNELEINRICEKLLYNINRKNSFILSESLSEFNEYLDV